MRGIISLINAWTLAAYVGAKQFITNEANRMKEDERGMEIVQVVIILLIVIVIVAALWTFLKPWVEELLQKMSDTKDSIEFDIAS